MMMNVESEYLSLLNDQVASSYPQVKAIHTIRRRGSLPFKKRRFPEFGSSEEDSDSESSLRLAHGDAHGKISQSSGQSDEKIAALALVAAAAASEAVPTSEGFPESQVARYLLSREEQGNHTPDASTLSSDLAAAVADLKSLHDANPSGFDSPKRLNQAPLESPLPSGCHGLTSRTNSYCRRQPCYNGSNYCKLHYQHYIVAGGQDPVDGDDISSEGIGAGSHVQTEGQGTLSEGAKTPVSSKMATSGGKGTQASQHQDKRYTGDPSETRCLATTTRGRDCAYCAVKDTKYCFLHKDYDTHPPPRRGGASFGSSSKVKASELPSGPPSVSSEESSSTPGKSSKSSGASKRKGSSMSARRASTCKNMEKHMADAPYPLLSVLATDRWFNQKVIISTGPLTNHVGHVEKWGNGWVSVRLPGVGLHNRRSFELYLHPDHDESGGTKTFEPASTDNQTAELEKAQHPSEGERDIKRCISRDKDSSPTPVRERERDTKAVTSQSNIHEITPLSTCKVIGIEQHRGLESDVQRVKNIMFPLMNSPKPTTVPESPLPTERLVTEVAVSGIDEDKTRDSESKFQLSVKTQSNHHKDDMPLVDLLSKEGCLGKGKFGLLFGTAALERSRRSIHRPTWYAPDANASKKRDLSPGHATDMNVAKKSKHTEDGIAEDAATPVVSASSEDEASSGLVAAKMASV